MKESIAKLDKKLIFREVFLSDESIRSNGGAVSGSISCTNGIAFFNTLSNSNKITYSFKTIAPNSVRLKLKFISIGLTQTIFDSRPSTGTTAPYFFFNSTGKLAYTNFDSLYIDGILYSSGVFTPILNKIYDIVLTTSTYTLYTLIIGNNYNFTIPSQCAFELCEIYSAILTQSEITNLYNNRRYKQLLKSSKILDVDAYSGAIQNRLSGGKVNGVSVPFVTPTDVKVVKAEGYGGMFYNGTSSKIDVGTYNGLTGDLTFVYIGKFNSYGGGGFGRLIDNGKLRIYITSTNNRLTVTSDGSTIIYSANNSILLGVPYVIIVRRKSDGKATIWIGSKNNSISLSGTADQASGTPTIGVENIILGGNIAQNRQLLGISKQFTIYNGILSDVECSQIWSSKQILL